MIRLHLDEHVHSAIAYGLRRRGIDLTTTPEAGLRSADDLDYIEFANREDRIVVTHDHDFLIIASSGVEHAGVFYVAQGKRTIGFLVRKIETLCEISTAETMRNHVTFL